MSVPWDSSLLNIRLDFVAQQEQQRSPLAQYSSHNTRDYLDDGDVRASDFDQPGAPGSTSPIPEFTEFINERMVDYENDQTGDDGPDMGLSFGPPGNDALPDHRQDPAVWKPWDPSHYSDFACISAGVHEHLVYGSENADGLKLEIDGILARERSPQVADNLRLSDTYPEPANLEFHQNGPGTQILPLDYSFEHNPLPPIPWAPRQPSADPAVGLQQERRAGERRAFEPAQAHTASTDVTSDPNVHYIGQAQLAAEAQPSDTNTNRSTPFQCKECGHVSRGLPSLRKHCQTHTDQIRKFKCVVAGCGMAFRYDKDRKKHMPKHDKSREFLCKEPKCSKTYGRADHLVRHMRRKHAGSAATDGILAAAANRLPCLQQPSTPRGTHSVLSGAPSTGSAMQDQRPLPLYDVNQMLHGVPASTSYDASVFAPDAAESMFTASNAAYPPGPELFYSGL